MSGIQGIAGKIKLVLVWTEGFQGKVGFSDKPSDLKAGATCIVSFMCPDPLGIKTVNVETKVMKVLHIDKSKYIPRMHTYHLAPLVEA